MATKLLMTHEANLRKRYKAGFTTIKAAINALIKADAARGLNTIYVALDDKSFGQFRAKSSEASFKNAVDHAYGLHQKPDYLLILGGPEIVPHQSLANPLTGADADDDPIVPSDLPYACDAPSNTDVNRFVGPSRVVGRLPDQPGSKDPARLVALLEASAAWKPKKTASKAFFGLSADVWKKSTTMSLASLGASAPRLSPLDGPGWSSADLKPLWHFINCHGAQADFQFYGQKGGSYPIAHQSPVLAGKVTTGTVVAAECCYGAELYALKAAPSPAMSVSYLDAGAIGFVGSTTIAYGPANSNGAADLICSYFLDAARKGSSLGSALLQARLKFVTTAAPLSPVDLKTLAQFLLLGDPSLAPVAAGGTLKNSAKVMQAKTMNRRSLESTASLVTRGIDSSEVKPSAVPGAELRAQLEAKARSEGYVPAGKARSYHVNRGGDVAARGLVHKGFSGAPPAEVTFHVMSANAPNGAAVPKAKSSNAKAKAQNGENRVSKRMIVLGREVAGQLIAIESLYAHIAEHTDGDRRESRQTTARRRLEE